MHTESTPSLDPRIDPTAKPVTAGDLDQLDLSRLYFWDRFVALKQSQCPRCGHHSWVAWRLDYHRHRGWRMRCAGCSQLWSQPQITPLRYADAKYSAGSSAPASHTVIQPLSSVCAP